MRLRGEHIRLHVLDLTNQYALHLTPYYNATAEETQINALKATGPPGKTNVKLNVAEGGSTQAFHALFKQQLAAFMNDPDAPENLQSGIFRRVWRIGTLSFLDVPPPAPTLSLSD